MDQESVVYGCIKDTLYSVSGDELLRHRDINRHVMQSLPAAEEWPLLSRDMFSLPGSTLSLEQSTTDVMHFGNAYRAVEYEWEQWLQTFEALLKKMYWVSATVHLETEFNGRHTFSWEPDDGYHEPGSDSLSMRCQWSRDADSF